MVGGKIGRGVSLMGRMGMGKGRGGTAGESAACLKREGKE